MNYFELEDLPVDIFERICSFLDYHDIAKLEQTSKTILSTIQELHLWRKVALTLIRKFDAPDVQYALIYIKKSATMCPKVCKILIGVTVLTTKVVDELKKSVNSRESVLREKEKIVEIFTRWDFI